MWFVKAVPYLSHSFIHIHVGMTANLEDAEASGEATIAPRHGLISQTRLLL